jgi:hypothetical protein
MRPVWRATGQIDGIIHRYQAMGNLNLLQRAAYGSMNLDAAGSNSLAGFLPQCGKPLSTCKASTPIRWEHVRHFAISEELYVGTAKRPGQLALEIAPKREAETMSIKVGDRVRIIANTPHKVGMETISLRGYTGVVKAVERYGDRAIVAVEKVAIRSGGSWRQTKLHIRIAVADLEIISDDESTS